jgi:hypothetical protein
MSTPLLEDVFKRSGVPYYTFVPPVDYTKLIVSLRTPGRGLVVEGPSGIGKTTSVTKALEELGLDKKCSKLSARKREDREMISLLPEIKRMGIVLIDDFHRLGDKTKLAIADHMKLLADEEDINNKVIVLGINKAGDTLINFAKDLTNRIDIIRFEANPEEKLVELATKGEAALNITINTKNDLARDAQGSFHIMQMLCHETCLQEAITEKQDQHKTTHVSIEVVREKVIEELSTSFFEVARKFATGPRLRREGRAPYLRLLYWLATENEWSLQIDQVIARHPEHKGSVQQIVDKEYLAIHFSNNPTFLDVLHFDNQTRVLSIEDPKFVYFIRNLLWSKFAKQVGFQTLEFKSKYDFALSFAGSDRDIAAMLFEKLTDVEMSIFYDKNEQYRILASNIEDYLGPIYRSEARYIVALLGPDYPKRVWTKFESEQFKQRFGEEAVIPIWFNTAPPGMFDETSRIGGFTFDRNIDVAQQVDDIVSMLTKKIAEMRVDEAKVELKELEEEFKLKSEEE